MSNDLVKKVDDLRIRHRRHLSAMYNHGSAGGNATLITDEIGVILDILAEVVARISVNDTSK